jgi:receptor protein-tyrosine kinase
MNDSWRNTMSTIEKALRQRRDRSSGEGKGSEPGSAESVSVREVQSFAQPGEIPKERPYHEIDFDRLRARGLLTPSDTKSQLAEEIRMIKRPIIRNALGAQSKQIRSSNLIMVTSALPAEGKTFCTLNLAISISIELNRTVLLVDADVARPSIPEVLGLEPREGLLDVLAHPEMSLADVIVRTNVENLSLLPPGTQQPHSTELLASDRMAAVAEEMSKRYPDRIILFDSPPLLVTTEASVLAQHMGQVILVIEAGRTPERAAKEALERLEPCDVVMTMLNKAPRGPGGDYGYYGYGYS